MTINELLNYLKDVKKRRNEYRNMCETAASKRTFKSEFSLFNKYIRTQLNNV